MRVLQDGADGQEHVCRRTPACADARCLLGVMVVACFPSVQKRN